MKVLAVLATIALFGVAYSSPVYNVVQNEDGEYFYLVPVQSRQRRDSGSSVGVDAQHRPGYGTDLNLNANANLWQQGNSRLDAVGTYGRHFGGSSGTNHPNYYGGLQFSHRF